MASCGQQYCTLNKITSGDQISVREWKRERCQDEVVFKSSNRWPLAKDVKCVCVEICV